MSNYKNNPIANHNSGLSRFFEILVIILTISIFVAGCFTVASVVSLKEPYKVVNVSYGVGEIVTEGQNIGKALGNDMSLYSKDYIECTGFQITTNFNKDCVYEVHYYTADNHYIGYAARTTLTYSVDPGNMPVLTDFIGNIDSDEYKAARENANSEAPVAAKIMVVIKPTGAASGYFGNTIFDGYEAYANKVDFIQAIEVKVTQLPAKDVPSSGGILGQ